MAESTTIRYQSWGVPKQGFENLTLIDREIPEVIGEHQIVVKVRATGLNPVDFKACEWDSSFSPFPRDVGLDVAGVVFRTGSAVDSTIFKIGQTSIFAHSQLRQTHGPLAPYAILDSRYVTIIPSDLLESVTEKQDIDSIYTDLAAIPCAGYSAYLAICVKLKIPIHADPTNIVNSQIRNIVVTAGAGGVGNFALQLLREWRAHNFTQEEQQNIRIITTCSEKNFEFVRSLGATHAIDYNTEDLPSKIKSILPEGESLDAWIDLVGAASTQHALNTLSFRGELVVVVDNVDYTNRLFSTMFSVHNISLGAAYANGTEKHKKDLARFGEIFLALYRAGKLQIKKAIISFNEVKESLAKIKAGHNTGKIVLQL